MNSLLQEEEIIEIVDNEREEIIDITLEDHNLFFANRHLHPQFRT